VKHWQELGQVLDRVLPRARSGHASALAVVTHIRGSAYRRPGARLLIEEDGPSLGGVSGGCLEEDVRRIGRQVIASGLSRRLHYETGDDDTVWGLGLGCNGEVDILVLPISVEAALGTWARVRDLLEGDEAFALTVAVEDGGASGVVAAGRAGRIAGRLLDAAADADVDALAGAALRAGTSRVHVEGSLTLFTEVLMPPPHLLVCGAGDDARPLVAFSAAMGFRVVVADPRAAYLTRERFPEARRLLPIRPDDASDGLPADGRTCAVVMTHSFPRDSSWVQRLASTDVPYIGVLGPRARTEKMLAALPPRARSRVFGPVGLDLGADGPEQVALSILAEVLAVTSAREPGHLRERALGVHAG
jgi:xanthine/CO dehydrogenase XdhC/CoxF family maturation factor